MLKMRTDGEASVLAELEAIESGYTARFQRAVAEFDEQPVFTVDGELFYLRDGDTEALCAPDYTCELMSLSRACDAAGAGGSLSSVMSSATATAIATGERSAIAPHDKIELGASPLMDVPRGAQIDFEVSARRPLPHRLSCAAHTCARRPLSAGDTGHGPQL